MAYKCEDIVCPICKKRFVPAPYHVFKRSAMLICGNTCVTEYDRRAEFVRSMVAKKIPVCCVVNGKLIGKFKNAKETAVFFGISKTEMFRYLHRLESHPGGYKFIYEGEELS